MTGRRVFPFFLFFFTRHISRWRLFVVCFVYPALCQLLKTKQLSTLIPRLYFLFLAEFCFVCCDNYAFPQITSVFFYNFHIFFDYLRNSFFTNQLMFLRLAIFLYTNSCCVLCLPSRT